MKYSISSKNLHSFECVAEPSTGTCICTCTYRLHNEECAMSSMAKEGNKDEELVLPVVDYVDFANLLD
jgi:hypothetical protein